MPAAAERPAEALLPQVRRFEIGPAGEEADPAMAEADEVLGRGDRAAQVVRVDGRHACDEAALWSTATTGRRYVHVDDCVGVTRIAPSVSAAHPRELALLPARLVFAPPAAGEHDEVVAGAADRPGGAFQQLGAERLDVGRPGSPNTFVRRLRMLWATRLDSYPSRSMTARDVREVCSATPYRSLMTFDTVATETPASAATSADRTSVAQPSAAILQPFRNRYR